MPPKKRAPKGMSKPLPPGQILTDLSKKQWKLGPLIGQGGFGYLYLGSDKTSSTVSDNAQYVVKVEPHSSGPLFVELAFYQRAAKHETILAWAKAKKLAHLGIPRFIGCGSFENNGTRYRFMIMDRFGKDVEKILLASDHKFSLSTTFSLGLRTVESLEYLHEQGYVHADIKASNMMTGFGKKNENLVYLLDYGLAFRYAPCGTHVVYKEDPKRKHDGTIEYTSRDAHKGLAPSRRGDLEILAYCMLQWLCGRLPWEDKLSDKDYVNSEKIKFMKNIPTSLKTCFGSSTVPSQLENFFKHIIKLEYTEKPDYDRIKQWFKDGLRSSGCSDDGKSVIFVPSSSPKRGRKTMKRSSAVLNDEVDEKQEETAEIKRSSLAKRAASRSPSKEPTRRAPVRKQLRRSPRKSNTSLNDSSYDNEEVKPAVIRKQASPVKPQRKPRAKQQPQRRVKRSGRGAKTVDFAQSP
eukprot:gene20159-22134_t